MSDLDDLLARADWPERHPDPVGAVQAAVDRSRRQRTRWAGGAGAVVTLAAVVFALLPSRASSEGEDLLGGPPSAAVCPSTPSRDDETSDRMIGVGATGLTICQYERSGAAGPLVSSSPIDVEDVPRLVAALAEVELETSPARACPTPPADRAELSIVASYPDGQVQRVTVETTCGPLRFVRADLEAPVPEDLIQDLGLAQLATISGDPPTPMRAAPDRPAVSQPRAEQLTSALRAFAADPSAERLGALPLADTVGLGLGDEVRAMVTRKALEDPRTWQIQSTGAGYAERSPGRFDVLAYLRNPIGRETLFNPAPHFCTGATPPSLDDAGLVSADGIDSTVGVHREPRSDYVSFPPSCSEKYSVKLFLREDRIVAITLALGSP